MTLARGFCALLCLAGAFSLASCSSPGTDLGTPDPDAGTPDSAETPPEGPATPVTAREEVPAALEQALVQAETLDADGLHAAYAPPAVAPLAFDPGTAAGMDTIQASSLALSTGELAKLAENGVVISTRQKFPTFAYGYRTIYAADLPVYVSADSILFAVHRSFDALLKGIERGSLIAELDQMLAGMHGRLAASALDSALMQDVDLYLVVARSLLGEQTMAPVAGADPATVSTIVGLARAASGHTSIKLFGVTRDEDFSQFKPRGHYTDSPELGRYFQAMMWLGRVDLRLIETQSDGSQVFYRRQFDSAVGLREVMGPTELGLWGHIDETIGAFVGEHDSMTLTDLGALLTTLGTTTYAATVGLTDQQIIDEIARGGWGAQRIASRIIIKDERGQGTLPLDRSFALFGQRYTVDSHVFTNVTYDRVLGRMMPNPLDVAFAALGNNAPLPLLASELGNASYVAGLAKTRVLVDAHEPAYWDGSLYTEWLGALRGLSPAASNPVPGIAQTDGWQSRVLNAQLASWAELRHDTILYVKQSYTVGVSCEFPDAYVDPYPELYARLGSFADRVTAISATLPAGLAELKQSADTWATDLRSVSLNLKTMAEDQQTGTAHSQALLDFINDAVRWDEQPMCGGPIRTNFGGWYLRLFLDSADRFGFDPTVADVHTQPTDEAGNDVGRILHVGTGYARLMVVTANTCTGPRAYVGLASSYGELITEDWERLDDDQWAQRIGSQPFPEAPWMGGVLAQ
jgi:hypothetical protein